jgi:hypothetical protein
MTPWGRANWSNGKQLLCHAQKDGYVELEVDVPDTARYTLDLDFSKAQDFGRIEVALDGQKMDKVFDGFHDGVGIPPEKVAFGIVELREGKHRLRFTAADKNPKASAYRMGIDCLRLTPLKVH